MENKKTKTFLNSTFFILWVKKRLNFILIEILFTSLLYLMFLIKMLLDNNKLSWTIFGIIGLSLLSIIFIANSFKKGIIINKLVKKAKVESDFIEIETFSFRVFNMIIFKSKTIKLNEKNINLLNGEFPIKDKNKINSRSLILNDEYYIMNEYFDENFFYLLKNPDSADL